VTVQVHHQTIKYWLIPND